MYAGAMVAAITGADATPPAAEGAAVIGDPGEAGLGGRARGGCFAASGNGWGEDLSRSGESRLPSIS